MKKIVFSAFLIATVPFSFSQTQGDLNEQEHKKYQNADRKLNEIYQRILKEYKHDTAFIKNLKTSQRIWLLFRDAEMKMKYPDSYQYGSVQPMCWSMYLTDLTQDRINTLKTWVDGTEEGDVCPGSVKIK